MGKKNKKRKSKKVKKSWKQSLKEININQQLTGLEKSIDGILNAISQVYEKKEWMITIALFSLVKSEIASLEKSIKADYPVLLERIYSIKTHFTRVEELLQSCT